MKKVLIVIGDMKIGGAQRSLLSFLKCLSASDGRQDYRIDLIVADPVGAFYDQLPAEVELLPTPKELHWLGTNFSKKLLKQHFSAKCLWGQMLWVLRKKAGLLPKEWNTQQKLWHNWKRLVPRLPGKYDIAISYIDGFPNYYVMEKVCADKKVLWVHNEYQKLGYAPAYDLPYYEEAQGIITISEKCRDCILQAFPQMEDKTHILENITIAQEVLDKSRQGICEEFSGYTGLKLLSTGRLNAQKGYDMAIEAAQILKQRGISFLWLVTGDGPERSRLQAQIEALGLEQDFLLLGSRDNPYAYMAACDILVQPSRFEGKSIVLDEAKILNKPIVATNYTTVADSLEHKKTGWIVDMDPEAIADGIICLWQDQTLRAEITRNLKAAEKGNAQQLQQYIATML